MPVEIRELVIRAVVTDQQDDTNTSSSQFDSEAGRTLLIQECVREVMKQLDKTRER